MSVLLHICCGPCTAYPLTALRGQGLKVRGFFHNPNIHPFREFSKRLEAVAGLAEKMALPVDYNHEYGLVKYLRRVVFNEEKRCAICYEMRLQATVEQAMATGAEAFSTTLLYSRHQKHEQIRQTAEKLAEQYKIPFYYQDFRAGWQQGIDMSKELGLYRQAYCGCIYSEQERYDMKSRKKQEKL